MTKRVVVSVGVLSTQAVQVTESPPGFVDWLVVGWVRPVSTGRNGRVHPLKSFLSLSLNPTVANVDVDLGVVVSSVETVAWSSSVVVAVYRGPGLSIAE